MSSSDGTEGRARTGGAIGADGAPGADRADGHRSRVPALRTLLVGLHGMFFVLLAVGVAGSGAAGWVLGVSLGAVYAAGAVAAMRGRGGLPGWLPLTWLAVVVALWAALVVVTPTAAYVAFPLYFLVLHLLPRWWSFAVVAGITVLVVATQASTSGGLTAAKVIGPCAGAAVAVLTAYGYAGMYREGRRRQRLIDELVRAQDELAASQREAGRLAERARLAREIHDTLAQGLSSIVLLARHAEGAATDPAQAAELREIRDTAASNLAEARRFVAALTPPALDGTPLGDALRRVAAGHQGVEFRLDGDPYPLPVEAEVALLRLTQEALANVERHADAERAAVTLAYLDDEVTLDVFDDGAGFEVAGAGAGGAGGGERFGLHGMRERIAELGGTLTIESAPGEGTAIAAVLPVAAWATSAPSAASGVTSDPAGTGLTAADLTATDPAADPSTTAPNPPDPAPTDPAAAALPATRLGTAAR